MIQFFRNLIRHDLLTKILALVVAIGMWVYVMNDQNPLMERSFEVPITYVDEPENHIITHSADSVYIKVRGPRSVFVNMDRSDFAATVSLVNFHEGTAPYFVNAVIPYGLEFLESQPSSVEVTLDPIITKNIKLDIGVNGTPPAGMTVYSATAKINAVTISGAKSAVDSVSKVVGYFNISSEYTETTKTVKLAALNSSGIEVPGITITPDNAEVSIELARSLMRKIVNIEPKVTGTLPSGIRLKNITVTPNNIEIAGSEQAMQNITTLSTEEIPLTDIKSNTTRKVKMFLPTEITVTNDEVTVDIAVEPTN